MAVAQTTAEQIAARRLDTVDRKVDLSLMVENRRGKTLLEARQRCLEISHLRILFGAPDGRAVPITNHESPSFAKATACQADHYVFQRGVGRAIGVGRALGVGVGLGLGVGVGVAVGVGVGPPPWKLNLPIRVDHEALLVAV